MAICDSCQVLNSKNYQLKWTDEWNLRSFLQRSLRKKKKKKKKKKTLCVTSRTKTGEKKTSCNLSKPKKNNHNFYNHFPSPYPKEKPTTPNRKKESKPKRTTKNPCLPTSPPPLAYRIRSASVPVAPRDIAALPPSAAAGARRLQKTGRARLSGGSKRSKIFVFYMNGPNGGHVFSKIFAAPPCSGVLLKGFEVAKRHKTLRCFLELFQEKGRDLAPRVFAARMCLSAR